MDALNQAYLAGFIKTAAPLGASAAAALLRKLLGRPAPFYRPMPAPRVDPARLANPFAQASRTPGSVLSARDVPRGGDIWSAGGNWRAN